MKARVIFSIIFNLAFTTCSDVDVISQQGHVPDIVPENEIITIPVVIHVVNFSPNPFEISDARILSQIDVLNQDYRKRNSDWVKTPEEFRNLVADVGIEFVLAKSDPWGNPTNGIIRTSSQVTGFEGLRFNDSVPIESLALYFTSKGGQDAWPADQYLNIWLADLSDRNGNLSLAGFANPPGSDARIDGIVIDPRAFGINPSAELPYSLGRTATHEVGHWLNLRHIYGKDGSCEDGEDGDLVDDTPVQQSQNFGNPIHPTMSCGNTSMFMNFMDRVDDRSMFMFTVGQKKRMRNLFDKTGPRRKLYEKNRTLNRHS
jgi:hypothetical protein